MDCITAHRINTRANQRRSYAALCEVAELVLTAVHPGNLGALPPSPFMLAYKAEQIGLLNPREASRLVVDARWGLSL